MFRRKLQLEVLEDRTLPNATVTGVSTPLPPNSTLGAGQQVIVTVNFSEAVNVSTSGPLWIQMNDSAHSYAYYNGGNVNNATSLQFSFTVPSGDTTNGNPLTFTSSTINLPSGATVTDTSDSAAANLALPNPGGANDNLYAAHILINAVTPNIPAQIQQLAQDFILMEQDLVNVNLPAFFQELQSYVALSLTVDQELTQIWLDSFMQINAG